MSCEVMQERISARVTDALSRAELNELEAHLAECPKCSEHAASLSHLWSALGDEPVPSQRMRGRLDALLVRERAGRPSAARPSAARPRARYLNAERWLPLAATLLFGVGLGYLWRDGDGSELTELRGEVAELHATVAESLLGQSSVSGRLRGVAYTRDLRGDDAEVTAALLRALRDDSSVNVRLAAIEALAPRMSGTARQGELVSAVAIQTSPLVQLSLIDALLDSGSPSVRQELERLLNDSRLDLPVREYLRDRLSRSV
jgi:anti-sigma factor RsiW